MSIELSPSAKAAVVSSQVVNQLNTMISTITKLLSHGIPAQGSNPAIPVADIVTALGETSVSQARLILAAASSSDLKKLNEALAKLL